MTKRARQNTWTGRFAQERAEAKELQQIREDIASLEEKLKGRGYDLDELDKDNPYNTWMRGE